MPAATKARCPRCNQTLYWCEAGGKTYRGQVLSCCTKDCLGPLPSERPALLKTA